MVFVKQYLKDKWFENVHFISVKTDIYKWGENTNDASCH